MPILRRAAILAVAAATVSLALSVPAGAATPLVLSMTGYSPNQGPVGTVVKITGTGFVAADIVQFNGTTASVSSVNKKGTTLTTSVPPLASSGPLTVTDPTTGQTVGIPGGIFQVTTGVHSDPSHAWPGETIELAGSALTPDTLEQLSIGGEFVEDVRTNLAGAFDVHVGIPWGQHTGRVSLTVLDPSLGQVISILTILAQWPQLGHDPARSGENPVEKTISKSNVIGLHARWSSNLGGIARTSPVVAGGMVFVGVDDDVVAEDAVTGATEWTFPTGDLVWGTPAVDNGIVLATSTDGWLYAIDASDGSFLWRFPAGTTASPLVNKGVVYAGSSDGTLWALGESDGHFIWSLGLGSELGTPTLAGGVLYLGARDDNLYAVKAKTGTELWSLGVGGYVPAPTVESGTILAPSGDGFLYAVDASTHTFLWHASAGTADYIDVAVSPGTVYLSNDYFVEALDLTTGTILWNYTTGFCGPGTPGYANGIVYSTCGNTLFGFDAATGSVLWTGLLAPNTNFDESGPAISGGRVYVGLIGDPPSVSGGVYAFGL